MNAPRHRVPRSVEWKGVDRRVHAVTALVSAVVVMASLAGCGGDGATEPGSPADSSTTVAPTTTVAPAPTAAPTTIVVSAMVFPTPKAAADVLFSAWSTGDRSAADAAHWALPAELDKLFGTAIIPTPKNRGCDDGLGGMSQCFVANGNGGINIDLVAATGGWTVQTITPFAGG